MKRQRNLSLYIYNTIIQKKEYYMKILKKSILVSIIALISILNFNGCSKKSAVDELYLTGLSASEDVKNNGASDIIAFKTGRRLIVQAVGVVTDFLDKNQCNTDKASKFAKKISNSAFDFEPLFVSLSKSKYCNDKKISNQEVREYQNNALEKLATKYDINVKDINK